MTEGHHGSRRSRPLAYPKLDEFDSVLTYIRTTTRQPGYRQRILSAGGSPVSLGTLRVLRAVKRAKRAPLAVGEIAESLAIDPSSASRLVDRCVDNGLLARRISAQDRRRSELTLTTDGRLLLAKVNSRRRRISSEATSGWTREDLDRLTYLLKRLGAGFDALEEGPP